LADGKPFQLAWKWAIWDILLGCECRIDELVQSMPKWIESVNLSAEDLHAQLVAAEG